MSESNNFVSVITIDTSSEASDNLVTSRSEQSITLPMSKLESENNSEQSSEAGSVSITMETSEPDSLNGKSDSSSSITSASDDEQAVNEIGVTNQAFVDDDEVSMNQKKGHQRSPSSSLGKEQTVCFHIVCLYTNTVSICFRAYQK